jgi:hypothetical protein
MLGGSDNVQHLVELAEMVFPHVAMRCSAAPASQQIVYQKHNAIFRFLHQVLIKGLLFYP